MKRMAQFFAIGVLLCVLAGCSNQPSAPANSPLSSASPSSETSPAPVLSPSATASVSPEATQATAVPTRKPGKTTARATQKPAATNTPTSTQKPAVSVNPTATPAPEPPAYRDATSCRSAMMKGINAARAEKGHDNASTSSSLNNIAQDRARQMAANQSVSHIGSGYLEAVGRMNSAGGAYNSGYVCVTMHNSQLLECSRYGIGVAIGRDGKYYYSIIGQ